MVSNLCVASTSADGRLCLWNVCLESEAVSLALTESHVVSVGDVQSLTVGTMLGGKPAMLLVVGTGLQVFRSVCE
jgi:hypothetical protein